METCLNDKLISALLEQGEGTTVDFKRDQYLISRKQLAGSEQKNDSTYFDKKKSELLKDVLAMANSFRRTDSYILIGVRGRAGEAAEIIGVDKAAVQDDADLQQFISAHAEKPITFEYKPVQYREHTLVVLRIPLEQPARPPFHSKNDYGVVRKGITYVRRGSHTEVAGEDILRAMFAEESQASKGTPPHVSLLDQHRNHTKHLAIPFKRVRVADPQSMPDFEDPRHWLAKALGSNPNRNYWRELATLAPIARNSAWVELEIVNSSAIYLTECTVQVMVTALGGSPVPAHNYIPDEPSQYSTQRKWRTEYDRFIEAQASPSGPWRARQLSARSLRPGDTSGFNDRLLLYFGDHAHLNIHYKVLAKELAQPAEGTLVATADDAFEQWNFEQLKTYASSDRLDRVPRTVIASHRIIE